MGKSKTSEPSRWGVYQGTGPYNKTKTQRAFVTSFPLKNLLNCSGVPGSGSPPPPPPSPFTKVRRQDQVLHSLRELRKVPVWQESDPLSLAGGTRGLLGELLKLPNHREQVFRHLLNLSLLSQGNIVIKLMSTFVPEPLSLLSCGYSVVQL